MYGETGYHGAYAAGQTEVGNGMHRSPSASKCTSSNVFFFISKLELQTIAAVDNFRL